MKYFLDTEFLEGPQTKTFFGIPVGKTKPTIDLISIGIVGEDNREYYAISKDFNIEEAWNRYDRAPQTMYEKQHDYSGRKIYWIRENVLKPIYDELFKKYNNRLTCYQLDSLNIDLHTFSYNSFSTLIEAYGKTNKQIAGEVRNFVMETGVDYGTGPHQYTPVEFYTYYGDYDWVVFCWLFGKMINLPTGFPMYSKDLKQSFDEFASRFSTRELPELTLSEKIDVIKKDLRYPKQDNAHNAIDDAKWNKALYEFIKSL